MCAARIHTNMNMQLTPSTATPIIPDDLIAEVISFLQVKSLVRFRCVSKSWKTLTYDPTFVKLHLKRSATTNPLFTLTTHHVLSTPDCKTQLYYSVLPFPISRLIENSSFTLSIDPYFSLNGKKCSGVIGTCNGLICLCGHDFSPFAPPPVYFKYWLRLWNPATRTISKIFGCFRDLRSSNAYCAFDFKFGCDNSTGKYKVVAFRYFRDQQRSDVRILTFGENVWRDIEGLPAVPLHAAICGVYLSGSINWLAICNNNRYGYKDIKVWKLVIVSLDLGTETYNQYMLPPGVDGVLSGEPTVSVLGGCLCFSYSHEETDFVIWQMKKFGVEDSWTQFLKISFQNLQIEYNFRLPAMMYGFPCVPLLLSENDDTLVLKSVKDSDAILYNWRDNRVERTKIDLDAILYNWSDNRVERTKITPGRIYWYMAMDFVESLVSVF